MAEIIGSFESLAEAQKLTQSVLMSGVLETMINEGAILGRCPVHRLNGLSLLYNREVFSIPTGLFKEPTSPRVWVEDMTRDQITAELEYFERSRVVNRYMARNWNNINDYEASVLTRMTKEVTYFLEDRLIYGDHSLDSKEPNGLHEIAEDTSAQVIHNSNNGDGTGDALSFQNLRKLMDLVRPRPDILLTSYQVARRIDSTVQEAGIATYMAGQVSFGKNELGARVTFFDGIPIVRSDWMVQTELLTSGNAWSTKTGGYTSSIFAIKFGLIEDGGFCILVGDESASGDPWEVRRIEELESHYGTGLIFRGSFSPALGSVKSLAVLYGITDAACVA